MGTPCPGVQRAPSPVGSRPCGTWEPRLGPDMVSGGLTVREADVLGGIGMVQQANAGASKGDRNRHRWLLSPGGRVGQLAGYRQMPGPKGG